MSIRVSQRTEDDCTVAVAAINEEAKQSKATRAWNLGTALYYKSGNIPWQPHGLPPDCCFVGISFHHLKRRSGDLVYASVAQAFSNQLEPFALKPERARRSFADDHSHCEAWDLQRR